MKPVAERKSPADKKAAIENPTQKGSGAGSRVPDTKLREAAEITLNLEEKSGKAPALTVAKRLGLSVAPEWLTSIRYQKILEVARFERKIKQMAARPELANMIQEVMDLGMVEAYRRLVMNPNEIPSTVLYGDILHKWPKMLREFQQSKKPEAAESVFINIVKEINLIGDPESRERTRKLILGSLDQAALVLSGVQTGDAKEDVVDVEGVPVPLDRVAPVVEPLRLEPAKPASPDSGAADDSRLWDDPALD